VGLKLSSLKDAWTTPLMAVLVLGMGFGLAPVSAWGDLRRFMRVAKDAQGRPIALETSVIQYQARLDKTDFKVSLVSAVHVAEKSYYNDLNRRFRGYDGLLYELITQHQDQKPAAHSDSSLSTLQRAVRGALGLEFQLDSIDYNASNFVHADLNADEFFSSMEARGESFLTMFLKAMAMSQVREPGKSPPPPDLNNVLLMAFGNSRALGLKRLMAEQLEESDSALEALNGPEGSTLITERNNRALSVLRSQIQKGRLNLAIFYGGAHMPNMEQELISRFSAREIGHEWLSAWKLQ
jgi:hypothetical protein